MLGCLEGSESRSVYALRGLDGMKGSASDLQGNVSGLRASSFRQSMFELSSSCRFSDAVSIFCLVFKFFLSLLG
jgi:hypothetical protein